MSSSKGMQEFIKKQNNLKTLRFITCGSVDDGKSTLLGRLLYESQLIFDDQIDNLVNDSKKIGTQGHDIDFALLVDGLAAEREQGITIDVAYRYFSTNKKKYIVADSPGHEQYTRNMVTASSTADLAIILIDSRKGILEQTKRHSFIANMVGIKNIIVAVNKMDLIKYSEKKFKKIVDNYQKDISSKLEFSDIKYIPISALKGDNIVESSSNMSWYEGEPILRILDKTEINEVKIKEFSMPVQLVSRPSQDFRGYSGRITSGAISNGDRVTVSSSNETASISKLFFGAEERNKCYKSESITLTLDKEIDISRGDTISTENFLEKGKIINTKLVWLQSEKGNKNRYYYLKIGSKTVNSKLLNIKSLIDVNTYNKISSNSLTMNDIAECEILCDEEISFKKYTTSSQLGSFILIDKQTNMTAAAGVINYQPRKSENVVWEDTKVDKLMRFELLGNTAKVLWFTGISGSGKSTIANLLEVALHEKGILTYLIDGDNLRHGLNRDLGFTDEDRIENIRRTGEVVKLFHDAGVFTLAAFISPFREDRDNVRKIFSKGEFIEIYVKTDLDTAISRDPKGLYKKAQSGNIPNFTGLNSPYQVPLSPEIEIDTTKLSASESVEKILKFIGKVK